MKVTKLKVVSFQGLRELEFEPGPGIVRITGANGVGKTSVLNALHAAFSNRSTHSRVVHDGEQEGLILFELDTGITGQRSRG